MLPGGAPKNELSTVRNLATSGEIVMSSRVRRYLLHRRYPVEVASRILCGLDVSDFHKCLRHRDNPSVWLDVYRPTIEGRRWYVKFAVSEGRVFVLSCCHDGEAH